MRDPDVTRFWLTLSEAAGLVMRAIDAPPAGRMIVPTLPAYRLGDLAEAMGVIWRRSSLHEGEKMHESLVPGASSADARRMSVDELREALETV